MRQVWTPPPATTASSSAAGAGIMKGSPGRNRPRLSAVSFTPDPQEDAARQLVTSDVAEARRQRSAPDGRTSGRLQGNGHVTTPDNDNNNDDDVRRRNDDDDDAAVQALLRELGVEPPAPLCQ